TRRQAKAQCDVLSDQTMEHLVDLYDLVVEAEHDRLEHLLAAERQELSGERGSPMGGFADLLEVLSGGAVLGELLGDELGIAEDGREDVVEVVGHAARQPPYGLHFLALA